MLQALDRAAAARAVGSSSSSEELGSSAFLDLLLYTQVGLIRGTSGLHRTAMAVWAGRGERPYPPGGQGQLLACWLPSLASAIRCLPGLTLLPACVQGCPPVDLLVRTSGETRLSDFLLWQSRHALLVFTPILWPDLGFLDLLSALVQYQRCKPALDRARRAEADALQAERRGGVRWDAAAAAAAAARAAALAGAADVCGGQPAATAAAGAPGSAEQQLGLQLWFPLRSPFLPEGRPAANGLPAPCTALPPLCTPSQAAGMLPPGASATAAALEAAAAALPCGPLVCACGSGSAGSTAGAADGVAMVKAVQLGGESPYAVASPELPSSPSARSTEGTPSPLPPKWGLRLRSPSSASMHSLTGGSPRLSNGGLPNGSGLLGGGSGGGLRFRSPSSHRLGSVDSFSSIDLYGDAQSTGSSANGGGGLAQQRQRPSYQDLLDAMQ